MRTRLSWAIAAAIAVFGAGTASATVYDFTANLNNGSNTGILTGTVDLAFVSGAGSGTGAASSLTITSYPTGVALNPNDTPTTWTTVADNSFTVTGGAVTSFLFFSGAGTDVGQSVLCLSSGGSDGLGDFSCPSNLIELHQTDGVFGYNFDGADGISFSSGAPEPAAWTVMLMGLGAVGGLLRARRKPQTAA